MTTARLEAILRGDTGLMTLMSRLRDLNLPDWRLVSGCIYQTVWNALTRRPTGTGILDYDVAYFDASDLSWDAEDAVIKRVAAACPGPVEVRNQARVHLWYEQRFGVAYAPLRDTDDSLTRYPTTASAVAARLEPDGRLSIAAPFGLDDLFAMVIRPGPLFSAKAVYEAKAARAKAVWPEAAVLPWSAP